MLNRIKKFLAARRKLKAIEELATISGNSGGLLLRIHENRQLMQLLYKEAPQLVESHFWLVGWIRCNDDFFNELNEILDLPFRRIRHEIYEFPRPWPEKDSTDDWPRFSQQSRSGAVHLNILSHVRNFFAVDRKLEAIDELAIKRGNMRGLVKRIDENRELLELLQSEVPQLVATDFWLVRWIRYNDIFFNELKEILQIPTRKGWSFPPYYPTYPRPWPAQNASEYGPDGTPLSQKQEA